MKLQYLSKKNIKELVSKIEGKSFDNEILLMIKNSRKAYFVEYPKFVIYVFDETPLLFEHVKAPGSLLPTLYFINTFLHSKGKPPLPWVRVDEGAVDPILRGADVMIPGIKEYTSFTKDNPVCVLEPNKKYAIAVGISLVSSADLNSVKKGKGIKVLSRLNDDIWKTCIEMVRKQRM